jgi:hypothetical protein
VLQRGPGCLGWRRLPLPLAVTVLAQARCLQGPRSAGKKRQPRQGRPAISMPENPSPGPVRGKSRRHAHGQGLQHASVSTPSSKSLGTSLARFGARATTACPVVSVCSRNLPAQVPTKPSSPTTYRRQQRSRRAMERVCRSRALSQIWARLQCDQLVSSVEVLNAECGPARYS